MKTIPGDLRTHIDGIVTTLATIWKIVRTDEVELFFTDHDKNITFDGDVYLASTGYSRTAVANNVGLAVGNIDVSGIFSEGGLTEEELRAGLYDYADIYMMLINWVDTSQGVLKLRRGKLGEVSSNPQGFYQAELRSLTQLLSQNIVKSYTAECRTDLGSIECKIPIQPSVLGREQEVVLGEFYRVPTKTLTGVDWTDLGLNMGFEQSATGLAKTSIEGWTVLLGNWNIFSSDNGLNPDVGSRFLSGGTSAASVLEQVLDISEIGIDASEVDAGDVEADFSIRRANQTATADTGRVIVQFRDVDGAILDTPLDTGAEAISPQDTWVTRSFTGEVLPVGTRQIRIQLSVVNVGGGESDTAFDNAVLTIHETERTNTFQEIYENRIYEVTTAGTTHATQPSYDTTIANPTTDGTAVLTARDAWMRHATISDVLDSKTLQVSVTEARAVDGWFDQGALAFESSDNSGKIQEIKTWTQTNAEIGIFLPFPFPALAGVKVRMYPGCDKRLATCSTKFSNVINFRGEPFIPGEDEYRKFADVR
jgi:hypothetical protein